MPLSQNQTTIPAINPVSGNSVFDWTLFPHLSTITSSVPGSITINYSPTNNPPDGYKIFAIMLAQSILLEFIAGPGIQFINTDATSNWQRWRYMTITKINNTTWHFLKK